MREDYFPIQSLLLRGGKQDERGGLAKKEKESGERAEHKKTNTSLVPQKRSIRRAPILHTGCLHQIRYFEF